MNTTEHRNTVIDGWRGLSVSLVIVGHLVGYRLKPLLTVDILDRFGAPFGTKLLAIVASLGELGVDFFFVISGFLITSLLLAENRKTDRVSLKGFYIRRIFRIMPAFYFYTIAVFVISQLGLIKIEPEAFIRSSAYLCNFSGFSCSWWLAHTWSLAVEEQFYVVWPILFILGFRNKTALIVFGLLAIASVFHPEFSSFSFIVIGVMVALNSRITLFITRTSPVFVKMILALLLVFPSLPYISYFSLVIILIKPFLVAAVFFGTLMTDDKCIIRQILQTRIFVKIGLVSYSLYLWQQLSLAPLEWGGGLTGASHLQELEPLIGVLFIPIAILSYVCIERPMVNLGHKLSKAVMRRQIDKLAIVSQPALSTLQDPSS